MYECGWFIVFNQAVTAQIDVVKIYIYIELISLAKIYAKALISRCYLCGRGDGQFLQVLHEQLQGDIIREHGSAAILLTKFEIELAKSVYRLISLKRVLLEQRQHQKRSRDVEEAT